MSRLLRFYGGSVREWLSVSHDDLLAMLEAARRIEAEERLMSIVDGQVAFGLSKESTSHIRKLERMAAGRLGKRENVVDLRQGVDKAAKQLASLGIAVRSTDG